MHLWNWPNPGIPDQWIINTCTEFIGTRLTKLTKAIEALDLHCYGEDY